MSDEPRKPGAFLPPRSRPARDTGEELIDLRAQVEVMIHTITARLNEGAGALSRLGKDVEGATATAKAANDAAVDARVAAAKFPWRTVTPFIVLGLTALVALAGAVARAPTREEIGRAQAALEERLRTLEGDVGRIRTELVRGAAAVEAIQHEQAEQGLRSGRLETKVDALLGRRPR